MVASQTEPGRLHELELRLRLLRERIATAAAAAGRQPDDITLIAVTKTWPATDIRALHALGQRDIGENRAQELADKLEQLDGIADPTLRWHFIGQLQRNKAGFVGRHCCAVHTVDRGSLVGPLDRAAREADRELEIFLQLRLSDDPTRGGTTEDQIDRLAEQVAASENLRLAGVMAIPRLGAAPRPAFAQLRAVSERLRARYPSALGISAGMSADLEDAVIEGATHLRVGTGLMGSRA